MHVFWNVTFMLLNEWVPSFQRTNKGSMIHQNVGNHSPKDTMSH